MPFFEIINSVNIYKSLLFIVAVLFLLGIISSVFPRDGVTLGNKQLYFPTVEDMLTKEAGHSTTASQRMKEMEESLRMKQYQDSLYQDSLSFYTTFFQNHASRIHLPDNQWDYFDDLFAELDTCQQAGKIVHILHYGDSQIEGDRITGYLRQKLQEKFGGNGPGLLPAVQPIPSSAVGQDFSGNIERFIVAGTLKNSAAHRRYGALGQVGMLSGNAMISVHARDWKVTFDNAKEFQKIRLFVGKPSENFQANLSNKKLSAPKAVRRNLPAVSVFSWNFNTPVQSFSLQLSGASEIYGIAVDGKSGVAVDNVPFRGSSGTFFSTTDAELMSSMLKELNVGLVMLEFGGNITPVVHSDKQIAQYKKTMSEQIVFFKKCNPKTKIIFIGPADMSTKIKGQLQTYPYLEQTIEALKQAALENGVAFWDMYEVMGGRNSMIDWVRNSPALAAKDYIHFSEKGAARISELFFESLMMYYDYYLFEKSQP
ncbi:hypothetical protein AGMMS50262_04210 [Bacteroidia bacterium]|nr:hypothetical protein AGMMS50262_04210 [Bacteroidia bacterium]